MNIYEKIQDVMRNVQYVQKDDHVEYKTTKYMAVSEEKVTSIMRAEMIRVGLIVYPVEMLSVREGQITHVDVKYRIVNVENPEEYIEVVSCGDGADSQDKGPGKAMTYAFKYMWLRTFALPTGDDPDKISSAELDDNARMAVIMQLKKIAKPNQLEYFCKIYNVKGIGDLTLQQAEQALNGLKAKGGTA